MRSIAERPFWKHIRASQHWSLLLGFIFMAPVILLGIGLIGQVWDDHASYTGVLTYLLGLPFFTGLTFAAGMAAYRWLHHARFPARLLLTGGILAAGVTHGIQWLMEYLLLWFGWFRPSYLFGFIETQYLLITCLWLGGTLLSLLLFPLLQRLYP